MAPDLADGASLRRGISLEEFDRMFEAGVFGRHERVELVEGELIVDPPMSPLVASRITCLNRLLVERLGDAATLRCRLPLPLKPRSEPWPEFTIAAFRADYYVEAHPSAMDALLVIEIGDVTRRFDRETKFPMYSRHGVRETWLVDLVDRRVTVGRDPAAFGYRQVLTLESGSVVVPGAVPTLSFTVDEVLGAAR